MEIPRWEYLTVVTSKPEDTAFGLKPYGDEGWELITTFPAFKTVGTVFVFKRPYTRIRLEYADPVRPPITRRVIRKDSYEWKEYLEHRFRNPKTDVFNWDGHNWKYEISSFDNVGEFDVIYRYEHTEKGTL